MFSRRQTSAGRDFSTNVTWRAPRLNASSPTLPQPAKKVEQAGAVKRAASILKSGARTIPDAGRAAAPFGVFNVRPWIVAGPDAHQRASTALESGMAIMPASLKT